MSKQTKISLTGLPKNAWDRIQHDMSINNQGQLKKVSKQFRNANENVLRSKINKKYSEERLIMAITSGNLSDLRQFIQFIPNNKLNLKSRDELKRTPLHTACMVQDLRRNNKYEVIKLLLVKASETINYVDYNNMTPLHYAILNTRPRELIKIIKLLKKHGADLTIETRLKHNTNHIESNISNMYMYESSGPIMLASQRYKPIDIILLLCNHIVTRNTRDQMYEIIKLLLPY